MKNHVKQAAELLGMEINEEFEIEDERGLNLVHQPYKFTEDYLLDGKGNVMFSVLGHLISGTYKIVKKPWKPKPGEEYFSIDFATDKDMGVYVNLWEGDCADTAMYIIGNVFKTRDEATLNIELFKKYIKNLEPNVSWRFKA